MSAQLKISTQIASASRADRIARRMAEAFGRVLPPQPTKLTNAAQGAAPNTHAGRRLGMGRERILAKQVPGLWPRAAFDRHLVREMTRADRTRRIATLLLFNIRPASEGEAVEEKAIVLLGRVVAERTRVTDIAGWRHTAEGPRVGLILPQTDPDAARRVVAKVSQAFRLAAGGRPRGLGPLPEVICETFGYPGDHARDEIGPKQLWLFDEETLAGLAPERNDSAPREALWEAG